MKIGILTFHESDNYGAVLQAYALATSLAKYNVDSEFISFEKKSEMPSETEKAVSPFLKKINQEKAKRSSHFDEFRSKYLSCSSPVPRDQALKLNQEYDLFLVGSDQVWNLRIPDADERFFLPFAEKEKRFSYAASFGEKELPEGVSEWCGKELSKFSMISVREEEGKELIQKLINRDVSVCLDPTLLLEPSEWDTLTHPVEASSYVLLFLLQYDEKLLKKAKEYAQEKGLQLVSITASFIPQLGFPAWTSYGVEDWLSMIKNASAVFTNSFHGTVFSLLFEVPVFVSYLAGELENRNGRLRELLKSTHMQKCLEEVTLLEARKLQEYLSEKKKNSLNYLKEVVSYGKNMQ